MLRKVMEWEVAETERRENLFNQFFLKFLLQYVNIVWRDISTDELFDQ